MKKLVLGNYETVIDSDWKSGCFEHDELGDMDSGSFEIENGHVTEIDGCFCIPKEVAKSIKKLGYKIDTDEFCI